DLPDHTTGLVAQRAIHTGHPDQRSHVAKFVIRQWFHTAAKNPFTPSSNKFPSISIPAAIPPDEPSQNRDFRQISPYFVSESVPFIFQNGTQRPIFRPESMPSAIRYLLS